MKYGNFVGKKNIDFEPKEIVAFKNAITEAIMCFPNRKSSECIVETNHYEWLNSVSFTFKWNPLTFRNWNKDRIINCSGIVFTCYKQTGYLETPENLKERLEKGIIPLNSDNPKFQYCMYIRINGRYIEYRHRTLCGITIPKSFDYGTEISDFDFKKAFNDLFNDILVPKK